MSPFQCRVEGMGGGDKALESHLEHLTARIPGLSMNEIPLELQGYTVGGVTEDEESVATDHLRSSLLS